MIDAVLQTFVKAANKNAEFDKLDITVTVGGFLISGTLVSSRTYLKNNPMTEPFLEVLDAEDKAEKEASEEEKLNADNGPSFMHLINAQYFLPGNAPCPTDGGVAVRINIHSVDAFHFGRLSTQPPN